MASLISSRIRLDNAPKSICVAVGLSAIPVLQNNNRKIRAESRDVAAQKEIARHGDRALRISRSDHPCPKLGALRNGERPGVKRRRRGRHRSIRGIANALSGTRPTQAHLKTAGEGLARNRNSHLTRGQSLIRSVDRTRCRREKISGTSQGGIRESCRNQPRTEQQIRTRCISI